MTALHRRPGITSVATLAAIVLTVGLTHAVAPEWSRAAGLDVWNAGAARADLAATLARGDELEAQNQSTLDQIRGSHGVVQRLGAGRLTLAAAADELAALNAGRPGWIDGLVYAHRDAPTPRHLAARYALAKLSRIDPAAWAAASARLEAELERMQDPDHHPAAR